MSLELSSPSILLCARSVSSTQTIMPVLEAVARLRKPLLIVADDVEGEALATLLDSTRRGSVQAAAVKAPGFGESRKAMLEDIAILTGGQLISDLEDFSPEGLGKAKKVIVEKNRTTIADGLGRVANMERRITQIRTQMQEATTAYDREKLEERLARLAAGVAILRVGGATEVEIKEQKRRVDDALYAMRLAVEEGFVAGNGSALLQSARALDALRAPNDTQKAGIEIVRRALQEPVRQIVEDAGFDGPVVVRAMLDQDDTDLGFDARSGGTVDMVKAGIIDPAKGVCSALQDAASVANRLADALRPSHTDVAGSAGGDSP